MPTVGIREVGRGLKAGTQGNVDDTEPSKAHQLSCVLEAASAIIGANCRPQMSAKQALQRALVHIGCRADLAGLDQMVEVTTHNPDGGVQSRMAMKRQAILPIRRPRAEGIGANAQGTGDLARSRCVELAVNAMQQKLRKGSPAERGVELAAFGPASVDEPHPGRWRWESYLRAL